MRSNKASAFYIQLVYLCYIPIIVIAKIIRYTVLKESTVDNGIGHGFISSIINGTPKFLFIWDKNLDKMSGAGGAGDNAVYIFKLFNWFSCTTYEEFEIAITIVFNLLLMFILYDFFSKIKQITKYQFFLILFFIGILNIYTFTLAKEPIQMLYFCLFYLVLRTHKRSDIKWFLSLVVICVIVVTSRSYYVLMLFFTLFVRYVFPWLRKHLKNNFYTSFIVFFIVAGFVYYVFLLASSVLRPDDFGELIRVRTRESEATTDIRALWPTMNVELFSVNYIITVLRLLFPVELMRFGVKYWPVAIYQIMITWILLKALKNYNSSSATKQIAICLYFGFLFCSGTFEPDFGSWIRHESVTIPFLLFVFVDDNIFAYRKRKYYKTRTLTNNVYSS